MVIRKKGSAVWKGGLKDGKGTVSTESGVLSNAQYGSIPGSKMGPAPIRKS
jgi:osmotically inducible protein OsmC